MVAKLFASTTGTDADFVVKVLERKEARLISFAGARSAAQKSLVKERQAQAYARWAEALEAGVAAALFGVPFAVVSGGIGCILGMGFVAWKWPQLVAYDWHEPQPAAATAD